MNRYILFLLSFIASVSVCAQLKLEFKSFDVDTYDVKARTREKKDINGDPTAILKIQIPMLENARIESPLKVGDEDYTPGEFLVYLGAGSKKVTIKHPDFEPFEYRFDTPLKGQCVYKLVLKVPDEYMTLGQISVKLVTNVLKAKLEIDNNIYETEDGEFILRLKAGTYPYVLSTPTAGFQTETGTLVITDEDVKGNGRVDRFLSLASDKKSNLLIKAHGSSEVFVDGEPFKDWKKKSITLPLGMHFIKVSIGDFHKTFKVNLTSENNEIDADLRVPLIIKSPTNGEFTITPIGNAIKPNTSKIKAGETTRLLGKYTIQAKNNGYQPTSIEVEAYPDFEGEMVLNIPMVSDARNLYFGTGGVKADRKKSKNKYADLIKKGDDVAMWELGNILLQEGDEALANTYIQRAANNGNPEALVYRAYMTKDPTEKRSMLSRAIENGSVVAHKYLGDSFLLQSPADLDKAMEEYSKYDDVYTRIRRAEILLSGYKGNSNIDIYGMLETVPESDELYSYCKKTMGDMNYEGIGTPQNVEKAIELWKSANIADLSDRALLILASENIDNKLVASNYLRYVNLNSIESNFLVHKGIELTTLLRAVGQKLAVKDESSDLKEAFRLIKKSYDLGDQSKTTLRILGKSYKDGEGTDKNPSQAKQVLGIAVSQYNDPDALRWLGNIYENEKNIELAEKYYLQAIAQGDNFSKGYYGTLMYNQGNKQKAVEYWTEAASKGHKASVKNLIKYYEKVERNPEKVNYWKNKL